MIENMERGARNIGVEELRAQVDKASFATIDALKSPLGANKRSFYEGLLENLNGARAWMSYNKLRYTSAVVLGITFLTSCAPAIVVVPIPDGEPNRPTITQTAPIPTETPTPLPTASPESLLPQEVKEKFELAGVDLTNMENAKYDKNGLHITLTSGEVVVLTNDELIKHVHNRQVDDALLIKDDENINVVFVYNSDNFVSVDLKNMSDDEKLAAAPKEITQTIEDEIDGSNSEVALTRSNVSSVKPELVVYRDGKGDIQSVYNLLTGESQTTTEAGIIEFDTVDDSKLEVLAFSDKQKVMDFMANDTLWFEGDRLALNNYITMTSEMKKEIVKTRDSISGIVPRNGSGLLPPYPEVENHESREFFNLLIYDLPNKGVVLIYIGSDSTVRILFFDNVSRQNDRGDLLTFILDKWKFEGSN